MSEETHDAATRGLIVIQTAVLVSGMLGWILTITTCFCINDLNSILHTPTGLPAAQPFLNAGGPGKAGGTIMWSFVILVQFCTGCSVMLADTRIAYAFARDEALPFPKLETSKGLPVDKPLTYFILAKANVYTLAPVNAVWFVIFFGICLNCIAVGSTQTATAIFIVMAPVLDLSYAYDAVRGYCSAINELWVNQVSRGLH